MLEKIPSLFFQNPKEYSVPLFSCQGFCVGREKRLHSNSNPVQEECPLSFQMIFGDMTSNPRGLSPCSIVLLRTLLLKSNLSPTSCKLFDCHHHLPSYWWWHIRTPQLARLVNSWSSLRNWCDFTVCHRPWLLFSVIWHNFSFSTHRWISAGNGIWQPVIATLEFLLMMMCLRFFQDVFLSTIFLSKVMTVTFVVLSRFCTHWKMHEQCRSRYFSLHVVAVLKDPYEIVIFLEHSVSCPVVETCFFSSDFIYPKQTQRLSYRSICVLNSFFRTLSFLEDSFLSCVVCDDDFTWLLDFSYPFFLSNSKISPCHHHLSSSIVCLFWKPFSLLMLELEILWERSELSWSKEKCHES